MCRAVNDEIREAFTIFGEGPFSLLKTRKFKEGLIIQYLNSLDCEKYCKLPLSALVIRNVGGWMWGLCCDTPDISQYLQSMTDFS